MLALTCAYLPLGSRVWGLYSLKHYEDVSLDTGSLPSSSVLLFGTVSLQSLKTPLLLQNFYSI